MQRFSIYLLAAGLTMLCGCSRSPQQREAKFLESGKKLLQKRDYARAALQFRRAVQIMPMDAEPYYQLGLAQEAAGRLDLAAASFRKAAEIDPKHAGAQLKLAGLLSLHNGKAALEDAQRRAQEVANAFPDNVDALNTLALTELRLGEPEEAARQLERALERLPGGLESAALLMRARLAQGDVKGAEEALLESVRKAPGSAEVALVLGRFYLVTHRPDLAEQQFRRAIQINPKSGPALMDLGMTLFHQHRGEEAGEIFRRVSALPDKVYKPVHAVFLLETGQRDAAIGEFQRLAREDPADRNARTRLVKMYLLAGRRREAEKLLADAIAKNPKDADALLQRSEISMEAGKYQDAENDLNLVLHFVPEAAEPHAIRARLYEIRGQALNQRQELSEALRLNPRLLAVRLDLARLLIASKAANTALEVLDQAPEAQKHAARLLVQRNYALLDLGRRDEARRGVDEGLRAARSPDLLLQDALLKMGDKRYAAARASLDEVLKQNPEDLRALRALMQIYTAQNQSAAALTAMREYAAAHKRSAAIQDFFGELLVLNRKPVEAREAFLAAKAADSGYRAADLALARLDVSEGKLESAHRILASLLAGHRNDPELWLYLGWLSNLERNYPQSLEYFQKVVDAEPANVVALNNLAYLLASQTTRFDEALKYAQQVKELAPDNPGVDDTIGWILYRKGLYPSAVKYLESAAKGESDPAVRYHLGMAYLKLGDKRGRATLREALTAAPDLPEAAMAQHLLTEAAPGSN